MFRLTTCITAACDDCGMDYNDDDTEYAGTFHFTDQNEALKSITEWSPDWRIHAGGRLTCRNCAADQDCATYGHHWDGSWLGCLCADSFAGPLPDHRTTPDGTCTHEHRWCDRCLTGQERPAGAA
jgi:hypothetical protein